ncbi:MAG: gamma-glutamyltransferase, partial [Vicinamibacterales bacterium]|nr:gamma-glutamyltransferase [Vicinamibacterales bacterium]
MSALTLFALAVVLAAPPQARVNSTSYVAPGLQPRGDGLQTRGAARLAPVTANTGMVASAHALASQAGIEIMKAGGNAVDAAVAAAFTIGVVEPNASGLGGEGMMVIYLAASKTAVAIDYRSTAPKVTRFESGIPATGHAAVAVPGTVAGLTLAQQKYGKLRLSTVMAPAVHLAEQGFVVSPTLAGIVVDNFEDIAQNEPTGRILCPGGLPVEAGTMLKNPDLARSLRAVAAGGADEFYRGALADKIVAEMAAHGGFITKDDLAGYKAVEREPVRATYRGYDLVSAPPPVAGITVLEILQILDHVSLAKTPHFSPRHVHLLAEAMKRGFADYTAFVGDPDFVSVPVPMLLSRDYA